MEKSSDSQQSMFVQGNQLSRADKTVSGTVQGITFHKPETGFFVARVLVPGLRDEQVVVGKAPSITEGEYLEAEGYWEKSVKYGCSQFKASLVRLSPPTDEAGLIKYLASSLPGVGPGTAKNIVRIFGLEAGEIIKNSPERLSEVPKLGKKRIALISEEWQKRSENHGVLSWLCGLGLSPAMAAEVYHQYGPPTREQVTQNPYQLAENISGIGFKRADAMAKRLGITPSNPNRIKAALKHLLKEATDSGSCGLPRKQLRGKALDLLNFTPEGLDLIDTQITFLTERGFIVEAPASGEDCLFLSYIYQSEFEIARNLVARLKTDLSKTVEQPAEVLAEAEDALGLKLEAIQRAAVLLALKEPVSVITGGPGTGKTTITKAIVRVFQDSGFEVLVCAPTGKAAKRASEAIGIPARTIHRTLEVKDGAFVHNEGNPLECDVLIVDELSMVDISLFRSLLAGLSFDTRLILIGDVDQLPSVGPGKVLADIIDSSVVPTERLIEVFRQARESSIIMNAHRVNGGLSPQLSQNAGKDFGFFNYPDDEDARIALLQTAVDIWRPGKFLPGKQYDPIRDVQVLAPMRKGKLGVDELNKQLQLRLNPRPEKEMPFRDGKIGTGDKVIQTKNNYEKAIFNGEIGYVSDIDPIERVLTVDFDGRPVRYTATEFDQVRLAYALTIHRSQGSEFPVVLLVVSYGHYVMLKRNLLYTGITRAKELLLIFGNPRAVAQAARNSQIDERYSKLKDWLVHHSRTRSDYPSIETALPLAS